ncbi:MAG: phospholipase D-like domain-containing protein [Pseudomonadota bacterium]
MPLPDPDRQGTDFQVFVTANTAYAAFERAVLDARRSVIGGFRIFDMSTALVSDEARAIGETWFDLLLHVLKGGVHIDLTLSDFDPTFATELHRQTWRTMRQAAGLAEMAGVGPDQLSVRASLHPATPGALPKLAFLPRTRREAARRRAKLSDAELEQEAPGLADPGPPELHTVTHHHKLAVIDDAVLYIGGLDLNPRRYDTPQHDRPAEETWSDVQVMIRDDPAVAEARRHLETFRDVVAGRRSAPQLSRIRRTLSADRWLKLPFLSPRTVVNELEDAHLTAFKRAGHMLYIETQFLRSKRIAEALADAGSANPDLTLLLVLPALPEQAAFADSDDDVGLDTRYGLALERQALDTVREAFGKRATIATPVQPIMAPRDSRATRAGSPIIYVHNKILVQDRDYALVGSANLNGRSLRWDTEAGLALTDPDRVELLRQTLHRHWWREDLPKAWQDPARMQPFWRAEIARNDGRRPENRRGFLVSHDVAHHADLEQPLPLVTDNVV